MRGRGNANRCRQVPLTCTAWIFVLGAALLLAALVSAPAALAAPGDLDTTFAGAGFRLDPLSPVGLENGAEAATLEGSKLLAAGRGISAGTVIIARYTESGSLDPTFGTNGVATVTIDPSAEYRPEVVGIYVDDHGRIVFAGDAGGSGSGFVARLNPDGAALDSSFGGGGVAHVAGDSVVNGLAQAPGEKPVVVGVSYPGAVAFVARLTADGDPDLAFGSGGMTETEVVREGFTQGGFKSVVIDGEEIIATSRGSLGAIFIARYGPSGELNQSFGEGGIATVAFGGVQERVRVMGTALATDRTLVIAGAHEGRAFLARVTAAGSMDQDFGTGGVTETTLNPSGYNPAEESSEADAIAIEPSGKIVIVGVANGGSGECMTEPPRRPPPEPSQPPLPPSDPPPCHRLPTTDRFALARYDATGSLDPTFGSGGIARYVFDEATMQPAAATVAAALIDPEGRLLVAGGERRIGGSADEGGYLAARFDLGAEAGSPEPAAPGLPVGHAAQAPARCVVPSLSGDTIARARRALRRAGCRLGNVIHRRTHRRHRNLAGKTNKSSSATVVLGSRPKAGAEFLTSARVVSLTVRRLPPPAARH
jgi:uncharacterized delta-60 repeat protein